MPRIAGRPSTGYLPALDGLRAIAVGLVVVHHASAAPFGGQIGVDIFFVLSGFLITGILLRERDKTGGIDFKRFYLRRGLRLYPALLVSLAALFIPGVIFAPSLGKYLVENVLAVTYTTPLAVLFANGASTAWRHTWSLGIEELFYIFWPILLLALLSSARHLVALAAGLGVAILAGGVTFDILAPEAGSGSSYLFRSGGLFVGCALALYLRRRPSLRVPSSFGWIGVSGIVAAVWLPEPVAAIVVAVCTAALLAHLGTRPESVLSGVLAIRPLTYLGRISYEIYLWHYPLLIIAGWALGGITPVAAWVMVAVSVVAAAATNTILARRIDAWKSAVSGKAQRVGPVSVEPTR